MHSFIQNINSNSPFSSQKETCSPWHSRICLVLSRHTLTKATRMDLFVLYDDQSLLKLQSHKRLILVREKVYTNCSYALFTCVVFLLCTMILFPVWIIAYATYIVSISVNIFRNNIYAIDWLVKYITLILLIFLIITVIYIIN